MTASVIEDGFGLQVGQMLDDADRVGDGLACGQIGFSLGSGRHMASSGDMTFDTSISIHFSITACCAAVFAHEADVSHKTLRVSPYPRLALPSLKDQRAKGGPGPRYSICFPPAAIAPDRNDRFRSMNRLAPGSLCAKEKLDARNKKPES